MSRIHTKLGSAIVFVACFMAAGTVRSGVGLTNKVGVRAEITGVVYRKTDNSVAVQWSVFHPSTTNVTSFTIQQSTNLQSWVDNTPTNTITGAGTHTGEASDFVTMQ